MSRYFLRSHKSVDARYTELHHNTYRRVQRVQVGEAPWGLRGEGSELWLIVRGDTLNVYSQTLTLLRSVKLEGASWARAVVPTQTGQLMVASTTGLHLLMANGSHIQTLQTGSFMDIVINQQVAYVLKEEYPNPSSVYIYNLNPTGQWVGIRSITLEYVLAYRLSVYDNTLFVTYRNMHHLYHYSMSGERLGQYGVEGSDKKGTRPGFFDRPYLCNTDPAGNALVADRDNHRLQVYSPHTGEWSVVLLIEKEAPDKAVVSKNGHTIWVVEWNPDDRRSDLVQYNKE